MQQNSSHIAHPALHSWPGPGPAAGPGPGPGPGLQGFWLRNQGHLTFLVLPVLLERGVGVMHYGGQRLVKKRCVKRREICLPRGSILSTVQELWPGWSVSCLSWCFLVASRCSFWCVDVMQAKPPPLHTTHLPHTASRRGRWTALCGSHSLRTTTTRRPCQCSRMLNTIW